MGINLKIIQILSQTPGLDLESLADEVYSDSDPALTDIPNTLSALEELKTENLVRKANGTTEIFFVKERVITSPARPRYYLPAQEEALIKKDNLRRRK